MLRACHEKAHFNLFLCPHFTFVLTSRSFQVMADLTILISPNPLPPLKSSAFGRFTKHHESPVSRPIMVTLAMADDSSTSAPSSPTYRQVTDHTLLSPPRNTWKSQPRVQRPDLPPRPRSAPPERLTFKLDLDIPAVVEPYTTSLFDRRRTPSFNSSAKGDHLSLPAPPLCK